MANRYTLAGMTISLASLCVSLAQAQLPSLADSPFSVRTEVLSLGLPFESPVRSPTFTQRIGPTNQLPIPGIPGQTLVTTLGGAVVTVDAQGTVASTFLDLQTPGSISANPDFEWGVAHGTTAFAFHPGYDQPTSAGYKKFFIVETETLNSGTADFSDSVRITTTAPGDFNGPHDEVLYEYTSTSPDDLTCDATCVGTKREVLRVAQPGWHHNIGDLVFDSDENLYISSGDGSTSGVVAPVISDNSALLTNVFGKILRIDPFGNNSSNGQYGIPADNPFVDGAGTNVDEIYAYGLRNPYRLDIDPVTGNLYASETGENQIESVNLIERGGNHGWNLKEGSFVYDSITKVVTEDIDANGNGVGDVAEANGLIDPLFEYGRDDGRAIIGGILYRGSGIPDLYGMYVFADTFGKLFYGDPSTGEAFNLQLDDSSFDLPNNSEGNPLPFEIHAVATDADGEITVLGMVREADGAFAAASVRLFNPLSCDFDDDRDCDPTDLATLYDNFGGSDSTFDLDESGIVDENDIEAWLSAASSSANPHNTNNVTFARGDVDFDGVVDSTDLGIVLNQFGENVTLYEDGELNGDAVVDSSDLGILLNNFGFQSAATAVPEPAGYLSAFWLLLILVCRRTRSSR